MKNGIVCVCRDRKADVGSLAGVFGCVAGTLSKSSLFSRWPPNKCLRKMQAASEGRLESGGFKQPLHALTLQGPRPEWSYFKSSVSTSSYVFRKEVEGKVWLPPFFFYRKKYNTDFQVFLLKTNGKPHWKEWWEDLFGFPKHTFGSFFKFHNQFHYIFISPHLCVPSDL